MKKLVFVALLAVLLSGCITTQEPDVPLVGDWGMGGTLVMRFTAGGEMVMYSGGMSTTYGYTAAGGSGEYWALASPDARVPFTYAISGRDMAFSFAATTVYVTKL